MQAIWSIRGGWWCTQMPTGHMSNMSHATSCTFVIWTRTETSGWLMSPDSPHPRAKSEWLKSELFWVSHQPFLLLRGYKLRPRYDPNWVPSWSGVRTMMTEDSQLPMVREKHCKMCYWKELMVYLWIWRPELESWMRCEYKIILKSSWNAPRQYMKKSPLLNIFHQKN